MQTLHRGRVCSVPGLSADAVRRCPLVARHTTLTFTTPRPDRRTPREDDPVAFDLSRPEQYEMVRRLFHARFSARVRAAKIDPEDALQTVVEGLLRKSKSEKSRWDPTRGSLATWVYTAMSGLVINMAESAGRRAHTATGRRADVASWVHVAALPSTEPAEEVVVGDVLDLFT